MKTLRKPFIKKTALAGGIALLVSGCAVTPEPISEDERLARASADLEAMFADQEGLTGPITLSEAMARAVKYNLDHRVKLMEEAVVRAIGISDVPNCRRSTGKATERFRCSRICFAIHRLTWAGRSRSPVTSAR